VGPNNWGIFLILPVTTGEGIGPAGEISPVVCMLKNALLRLVKSYLPSTMSADRLDDCMELASEKDLVDSIDLTKVAKKWSLLNNHHE